VNARRVPQQQWVDTNVADNERLRPTWEPEILSQQQLKAKA